VSLFFYLFHFAIILCHFNYVIADVTAVFSDEYMIFIKKNCISWRDIKRWS